LGSDSHKLLSVILTIISVIIEIIKLVIDFFIKKELNLCVIFEIIKLLIDFFIKKGLRLFVIFENVEQILFSELLLLVEVFNLDAQIKVSHHLS